MEIKRTLDNVPRFVFWRIDEVIITLIPFSIGLLCGSLWVMVGSFVVALIYRKFRKKTENLNLKALIYWVFGEGFANIPSHIRRIRR